MKDSRSVEGKPQFLLPGDGTIDYAKYFSLLKTHGYKGWILVEISRQLQVEPHYDPISAAERSYRFLARHLRQSNRRQKD
jgi:sugar phosphate isomerase/epimerase